MATRIVIEEHCGCVSGLLYPTAAEHDRCNGTGWVRRVLDPGSYVLIEKQDGEWPKWALLRLVRAIPQSRNMSPILNALAGGES